MSARLSVNINKIALLRNSRENNLPDLLKFAVDCERYGAEGITVHPRPDERHIRKSDVYALKKIVKTEFNIEGYPSPDFIRLIQEIKPDQVTLVPDPPGVLTSSEGWNTISDQDFLKSVITDLKKYAGRVSLFLNPDVTMIESCHLTGAHRIELYTGDYATNYNIDKDLAIEPFIQTAQKAEQLGLGVNAGHDLNLDNLFFFSKKIRNLAEVSIGHALVADALYYGIGNTINMYKQKLNVQ